MQAVDEKLIINKISSSLMIMSCYFMHNYDIVLLL